MILLTVTLLSTTEMCNPASMAKGIWQHLKETSLIVTEIIGNWENSAESALSVAALIIPEPHILKLKVEVLWKKEEKQTILQVL